MKPRLVTLCDVRESELKMGPNKPLTPSERNERYRQRHPERIRDSMRRFLEANPTYHRDYWRRKNGKAA